MHSYQTQRKNTTRAPLDSLSDDAVSLLCASRRQWVPNFFLSDSRSGEVIRELAEAGFVTLRRVEPEPGDPAPVWRVYWRSRR